MSKSLVFFGNERLATGVSTKTPALNGLIECGYDMAAIVVNNTEAKGRRKRELEVAEVAKRHNIPVIDSSEATVDKLKELGAQAGVLAAYGKLVPKEVIEVFPRGIVNIHPSLLPLYRGSTPVEQAILDGAEQTGVSLMALVSKMDAGPVYAQEKIRLKGNETKQELADTLNELGSRILLAKLGSVLDGTLEPKPQDESSASYTGQISKNDGVLDLSKPAEVLEREIRAYLSWPRSRTNIFGRDIIITKSNVAEAPHDGSLVLQCSPGFLEITELIAPSGRKISGRDFLRGYHTS